MIDFTDIDADQLKVSLPMRMMFRIKDIDNSRGFRRYLEGVARPAILTTFEHHERVKNDGRRGAEKEERTMAKGIRDKSRSWAWAARSSASAGTRKPTT